MKRINIMMQSLIFILGIGVQTVFAGQVLVVENESEILDRPWPFSVYLPDGYAESSEPFPVLYLLHGNGDFFHRIGEVGHIRQQYQNPFAL